MVETAGAIAGIVSAVLDVGKCFMSLFNHKSNLRNLETEVGKLKLARGKVKGMVEVARNKAEKIEETVELWVSDVDSIVPEAETLINGRANVRCFNLGARYKLRRKASRKVEDISQLLKQQEAFGDRVSRPIIHEDTRLILNKDYLAFQSRSSTLEDVLKALKEAEVDIIGVHGMGGIGKTTLVKEVVRQAKADKRFDKVIFVEVTDTPNIEKIREEIADNLDLELDDKKTETGKANKLFARLKEVKTILIILDNIWDELDLEKLGIPVGENHKGCKLLLTARDRNVLDRMGSKSFSIDVLKEDEAWNLFRKMTGEDVDTCELQSLANDVCKECGGLPIAIVTVARALMNKRQLSQWRKALQELRSPSPAEFKGVLKEAYSKIALSYNYLEGEELKKVFLLCSIMTHDASISNLFKFVMGLNILEGNNLKIEEARDRLDALLHELKESCLLLDCSSSERFSMHDVVRDIAITISYKDHHVLTERNDVEGEWKNLDILKKCTTISLSSSDIISKHWAEGLECPELEFLYMDMEDSSFKFPERFFSGMAKLKVLSLNFLPSPIILPIGLQTLCLDGSEIEEVAIIGELKKLKILSLRYCHNIKQLPGEISQLIELRLLDLSYCEYLKVITPSVISSLVQLEELYMRGCPVLWAVGGPSVERNNASLEELLHLSCLTALEIDIKGVKILPKGFFSKELKRYHISVNHDDVSFMHPWNFGFHWHMRTIKLKLNSSICLSELQGIKSVEFLCLDELQNVKNGLQELDNDGFSQLKHLCVHNNPNLLCLVDSTKCVTAFPLLESLILFNMINLERICNGQPSTKFLCNLKSVEVKGCDELKFLVSFSTTKSLPQLQRLTVEDCKNVKEIFAIEREENVNNGSGKIEFFQLRFLTLKHLPRLGSFCSGMTTTSTSQSRHDELTLFDEKLVFPLLESLILFDMINLERICNGQPSTKFLCNLQFIEVKGCDELKFLISFSTTKSLPQLQRLTVEHCKNMKEIFAIEREENVNNGSSKIEFFQLRLLTLKHLPRLGSFCSGMTTTSTSQSRHDELTLFDEKLVFPTLEALELECIGSGMIWCSHLPTFMTSSYNNLTSLTVLGCGNLKYIFPTFIVQSFKHLQHLEICECRDLKEIVANGAEATPKFVFPQVTFLKLDYLPKLTTFYLGRHLSEWPLLEKLQVCDCKKVKIFTSECGSSNENNTEAQFDISEPALFLIEKINPDLKELIVDSMIPLGILERFNNLEKLKLNGDSDEVLFVCKEEEKHIEIPMKIKHLELDHLHHLKHLWKEGCKLDPILLFQNLTHLTVTDCHKIEMNLITPSVVRSLRQLRKMTIKECSMIIVVVVDERDAAKDEIDFPNLKSLSLDGLKNLMCFYSGNYILKFPSLEDLNVMACYNMKTFSQGVLSAPKLQNVVIDWEAQWEGDLNSTIQQSYKNEGNFDPKPLTLIGKDIKQICRGQIPDEPKVDQVKALEICKDESRSIPVEILETFHNLKSLKLKASSYKELFSCGNDDKCVGTFTQLKNLEVLHCHNLTTLEPSSTSFENLVTLEVQYCIGLRSLLTSSTAKSLVRLQKMTIKQCKMLTEVVANGGDVEKDVVFRKLESLSLDCLENLTSFCSGNYTFKFLSLQRLIVHNCPKMETFSGGVLSTPKLQKVKRHGDLHRFPAADVFGCWDYDLNTTIKQLQKMVVFPDMKVPKLSSTLLDIQHLTSTSSSYRNITHFILFGFHHLNYVFPSSLVKCFEQLQQLEIRWCQVLKEIVTMEEVETTSTFVFSRVTTLILENLSELTSFCLGKHTSEWPVLTTLEVYNCDKVKTFTSEHLSFHKDSEEAHSLLLVEKINSNLEALRLSEIDSVMTWQGPFSENFFCKLKCLEIMNTHVPIGILQRFKNLEMLKLHRIQSREIFLCGKDEKTIGMPTHIKGLELDTCDNLEYLWKQGSKIASILQNLEVLEVNYCWKLINVVSSSTSFQNLKVLTIADCSEMVNIITSSVAKSMVQLTEMEIQGCSMLIEIVEDDQDEAEEEIIFTKLKWLSLENLRSLTCFCTGKYTFKFPTLEELTVEDCPNMKTFCEGVLSTPRLQKVWEEKCLNVGSCSEGELNTIIRQLHRNMVHSDSEIFTISGKDITPTWPDQFSSHDFGKGKSLEFIKDESTSNAGILSKIQNLHVYKCYKLTTLVPSSASFENLTTLRVWHCDGLKNLISFATAKSLKQLEEMTIKQCEMMTEIVANEGDVENDKIVFSNLWSLSIADLKSFTCLCSGNYTFEFPYLERIDVKRCPKMKTFSGGVLSTPNLWRIDYNMEYYKKEYEEDSCDVNEIIQQLHKKSECSES